MVSLEEYSKICGLLSSCNDMIDGKFILADYKIANILKNITGSKEVYNLIANQMNNFNFERELSKAQLRSSTKPNKFKLPDEPEKVLPFIFCILVGIKNKEIDFDLFLKEYYSNEKGRAEEYINFASEIILPFRDIIAECFEIPIEDINKNVFSNFPDKSQAELQKENFKPYFKKPEKIISTKQDLDNEQRKKINENGYGIGKSNNANITSKENQEGDNMRLENSEEIENTVNKVEQFLAEVAGICKDIKSELNYDKRVNKNLKDDLIYITNIILSDCEKVDLKNVVALITAYDYMAFSVRSIKFLTKELKKLVIDFYNE